MWCCYRSSRCWPFRCGYSCAGVPGLVAWGARAAAYGYATFYTVTDVLAGIGAGELTRRAGEQGVPEGTVQVDTLFSVGNELGTIGVWCFAVACAATALALVVQIGRRAVPGAMVLLVGAVCLPAVSTSTGRTAS